MGNDLKRLSVLIPAYMPEETLKSLAQSLLDAGFFEVVVVDDGGGADYAHIFAHLNDIGCRVLTHAINMGKGRALKTGINDILARGADIDGVVTADADGQHLPADIIAVGQRMLETDSAIVLGKRTMRGKVPLKSRLGNTITRGVFGAVSGQRIYDTQTGLRALPMSALPGLLALPGERYEYEMNMLLEARGLGYDLVEVDIKTVYIDDNSGSHFNPWRDSWRIYRLIIMFGASSLIAFLVDFLIFTLLILIVGDKQEVLWIPVVGARIVSSFVNFVVNRNAVFGKRGTDGKLVRHVVGYYALVVVILAANYALISLLSAAGLNVFVAKIFTEAVLFIVSFLAQKHIVFR